MLVLAAVLAGCGKAAPVAAGRQSSPTAAAKPVSAPPLHACYQLDVAAGLQLSSSAPAISCQGPHTSLTVGIGHLDPVVDGHLLAIESAPLQRQIAHNCQVTVDSYVGGSNETRRLSRVQAVWFSPTPAQSAGGARWFRCDLVIAGSTTTFANLPAVTRHLLSARNALNQYGTCGTAAPGTTAFQRVTCSQPHTWRARASIRLPVGATYLAKAAGKTANARCRDIEARRAVDLTRLRWSFEWPTKAQWVGGQRYGLCWTPG
jgi:hypothetical protein